MAGFLLSTIRRGDIRRSHFWEFQLVNPSTELAVDFFFYTGFSYIVCRWDDNDNLTGYLETNMLVTMEWLQKLACGIYKPIDAYLHNKRTIPRSYLKYGDGFEHGENTAYKGLVLEK